MKKTWNVLMLFDGTCNFCSNGVRIILKRTDDNLSFCAMQTDAGQKLLTELGLPLSDFETLVVIENEKILYKSEAIIRLFELMNLPWKPIGRSVRLIPKSIRDWMYDVVARNRYRIMGQRSQCIVPDPVVRSRFLE